MSSPRTMQSNPPLTFDRAQYTENNTATPALNPNQVVLANGAQGQGQHPDGVMFGENDMKSPFRSQLGEFMLESDFSYLHSILPPLGMGEMGMPGEQYENGGGYGNMGFGA